MKRFLHIGFAAAGLFTAASLIQAQGAKPLFEEGFQSAKVGEVSEAFMVLDGQFVVGEEMQQLSAGPFVPQPVCRRKLRPRSVRPLELQFQRTPRLFRDTDGKAWLFVREDLRTLEFLLQRPRKQHLLGKRTQFHVPG